jgi:NAD(P)-dependent dehydrogenase (short-subunit alcohol dehydrogenase family)
VKLDVCDADAVKAVVDETAAAQGRLDYMFNNAGIAISGEERDVSLDDWNRVLAVDLHGVVHGVRAAYAIMVRQGSGHIVNTASAAGLTPLAGHASYTAAKYGVVGLSHALRVEGAGLGVRVSVVCPGFVDTPILTHSPLRGNVDRAKLTALTPRRMPPARCARIVLEGVLANRATILVGAEAKALWGLSRVSPDAVLWLATRIVDRLRRVAREG